MIAKIVTGIIILGLIVGFLYLQACSIFGDD